MKKILMAALVAAMAASASAEMKFGTVDMLVLVRNHPQYESNKKLLTTTEADLQKKVDVLKDEVEKVQAEGKKLADEARNPMLAQAAKEKLEKELLAVQERYVEAQQRLRNEAMNGQRELQDLESRLLKMTSEDLRKRVTEFATKNGYDLIVDASAAPYAKPALDATNAMLEFMGVDPKKAKKPGSDHEGK